MEAYLFFHVSFVRIHPFFDGNGRLARLLANMSAIAAGLPPIVIPAEARLEYIRELWDYQRSVGVISRASKELLPHDNRLDGLRRFLLEWRQTTLGLVAETRQRGSAPNHDL